MKRVLATIFGLFLMPNIVFAQTLPYLFVTVPNDPLYPEQKYLQRVEAEQAWGKSTGSRDVVVAVLDTGVDISHPDLRDNIWRNIKETPGDGVDNDGNGFVDDVYGWDFADNTPNVSPRIEGAVNAGGLSHGTFVAGVIGAVGNNGVGIAGLNWQVRIMPLRLLNSSGYGVTDKVDDAIRYAVAQGAQIINLSFTSDVYSSDIEKAIADAYAAGVLVVTAAGNDLFGDGVNLNSSSIYPACFGIAGTNTVLTVASTDALDRKASFSNYGSRCVDMAAPGEDILGLQAVSALTPEGYVSGWSGTSMSAPMVAGAAAILKSTYPTLRAPELMQALLESADSVDLLNPSYVGGLGRGRLNIRAALEKAATVKVTSTSASKRLVAVKGAGGGPTVQVFDDAGLLLHVFTAYDSRFTGGVRVATGDLDGDGSDEIVTAPGAGGGPHIRVFSMRGEVLGEFMAYDAKFTGGVTVAVGDVDGDGKAEIVTGAGAGGGPHVRVFDMKGREKGGFFAFGAKFVGGVSVAVGDIDGDGTGEVLAGMWSGGKSVRAFNKDGALVAVFPDVPVVNGMWLLAADVAGDGRAEVIAADRRSGTTVRIFNAAGTVSATWRASGVKFPYGFLVGRGLKDAAGKDTILLGTPASGDVRTYSGAGKLLQVNKVFVGGTPGGVQVVGGVERR